MSNFRNLKIWKNGIALVLAAYKLARDPPPEEKYGLKCQITRAAVSIPTNIAEGSSRSGKKDFKRFLEIALGSAFELETQLILIQQMNFCNNEYIKELLDSLHEEQKMIRGFMKKLEDRD